MFPRFKPKLRCHWAHARWVMSTALDIMYRIVSDPGPSILALSALTTFDPYPCHPGVIVIRVGEQNKWDLLLSSLYSAPAHDAVEK